METRVTNWPIVLNEEIDRWRRRPFRWGSADCIQFVAEVAQALTGTDYRLAFPRYSSEEEAQAIIASYGGLAELVTSALGPSKPVSFAHRGDAVIADLANGPTLAICAGVHSFAMDARGLSPFETRLASLAWSI